MSKIPNLSLDELLKQATCAVLIDGEARGTAWLVNNTGYLLTAGHILGEKEPCNEVQVCFVGEEPRQAHKVEWHFEEGMGIDFAVIKLTDLLPNRYPLPVSLTESAEGTFRLRGYGVTLPGQSVGEGRILGTYEPPKAIGNHLFQLRSPEVSERGYSGAAVFSNELQAVVAIQIEATKTRIGAGQNTVLAMPLYRIAQEWSLLSQLKRQITKEDVLRGLYQAYRKEPFEKVSSEKIRHNLGLNRDDMNDMILALVERGFMQAVFVGHRALLSITGDGVTVLKE